MQPFWLFASGGKVRLHHQLVGSGALSASRRSLPRTYSVRAGARSSSPSRHRRRGGPSRTNDTASVGAVDVPRARHDLGREPADAPGGGSRSETGHAAESTVCRRRWRARATALHGVSTPSVHPRSAHRAAGRQRWVLESRTRPLGDGDVQDRPEALCVDVVGHLPRCTDLISADDAIRRIELYFRGEHCNERPPLARTPSTRPRAAAAN